MQILPDIFLLHFAIYLLSNLIYYTQYQYTLYHQYQSNAITIIVAYVVARLYIPESHKQSNFIHKIIIHCEKRGWNEKALIETLSKHIQPGIRVSSTFCLVAGTLVASFILEKWLVLLRPLLWLLRLLLFAIELLLLQSSWTKKIHRTVEMVTLTMAQTSDIGNGIIWIKFCCKFYYSICRLMWRACKGTKSEQTLPVCLCFKNLFYLPFGCWADYGHAFNFLRFFLQWTMAAVYMHLWPNRRYYEWFYVL